MSATPATLRPAPSSPAIPGHAALGRPALSPAAMSPAAMSPTTMSPAVSGRARAAAAGHPAGSDRPASSGHPASGQPTGRGRRSRAEGRRSTPAPVPVAQGLQVARRPWHLQTTGTGLLGSRVLDEDTPVDVVAGLAAATAEPVGARVLVRGAVAADLPALAAMHGRCTGSTLLQRYRTGGRAPSLTALTAMLDDPFVLVVLSAPRQVVAVATAHVGQRPSSDFSSEMSLLVEDAWQARGIGTTLARHVGASLRCLGYGQAITRSATSSLPLSRVMEGVGTTRSGVAPDGGSQLVTRLDVSALDGLAGGVAL